MYAGIEQLEASFPISAVCELLNVSRSSYYQWRHGVASPRRREDQQLKMIVRSIFFEHKRRYGARRIAKELSSRSLPGGRRRVARLMEEMGLVAIQPRSFKPQTTNSRHKLGYSPNLLVDTPPPDGKDQLWVSDITYVPLIAREYLYLALVMDRYSRHIVGWNLQNHLQESLVLGALQSAIALRRPGAGLICHSDRGGQYAGTKYRDLLRRARMQQSMSRADNCYDNAFMESCFGTMKTELEMKAYDSHRVARQRFPSTSATTTHGVAIPR